MAKQKKPEVEAPVKQEGGSAKLAAIRLAMDQIEKQYGKGSIMRLGGGRRTQRRPRKQTARLI